MAMIQRKHPTSTSDRRPPSERVLIPLLLKHGIYKQPSCHKGKYHQHYICHNIERLSLPERMRMRTINQVLKWGKREVQIRLPYKIVHKNIGRPHYNLVVISTHVHGYRVERLMVDKDNGPSLVFANFWAYMKLLDKLIHDVMMEVTRFNGHKPNPKGRITLIIFLMGKLMVVYFFLMNYNTLYNGILGRDWTIPMEIAISARFQCIELPTQEWVAKVRSNQMIAHNYNERAFDDYQLSKVNMNTNLAA